MHNLIPLSYMCSNAAGRKRGAKMKIRKVLISLVTCFIVSCFIHVTHRSS